MTSRLGSGRTLLVAVALLLFVGIPHARATVVLALDVEEMADEATDVVHGTVTSVAVVADQEGKRFWTVVEVDVAERLKGNRGAPASPRDILRVRLPGGTMGGLRQVVAGVPTLAAGDEVVLFLWRGHPGTDTRLLGLSQGTFRVDRSRETGPADAVSDRSGLGLVRRDATGLVPDEAEASRELRLPLPSLLDRVRARVRQGGAQ